MSVAPVALFLTDFGKDLTPEVIPDAPLLHVGLGDSIWSERVDEAYARGLDEARQAAETEVADRLEQQKATLELSLAAAREAWVDEAGPRIAAQIADAVGSMEDSIAGAVERVLRPFLAQAARDNAVSRLRDIIRDLIAGNPTINIEVSGPEDLLATVRASLSQSIPNAIYTVNDTTDIQIKAGASVLETRIAAWLESCEGKAA